MITAILVVAIAALNTGTAGAQKAGATLTIQALQQLESVAEYRLSPDGEQVALQVVQRRP